MQIHWYKYRLGTKTINLIGIKGINIIVILRRVLPKACVESSVCHFAVVEPPMLGIAVESSLERAE